MTWASTSIGFFGPVALAVLLSLLLVYFFRE